ncbi:CAP domain-containing protein [Polaromonas sp. P2-4]|nr:CAP domain-containing protein [Polaromonas sp. P2-4]
MRAAQITLQGYSGAAALAQGVVGHSCSTVTQGELAEAGFHQHGTQTWIVLAAPFSPPGAAQAGDVQARVLALVNEARARPRRCGTQAFAAARPLRLNTTLHGIATDHAADMARYSYFSHTGRNGSSVDGRASRAGYPWRAIGENIAAGQMQADAAVQGWLNSPGHCANLMSPTYTEMGTAFAVNNQSSAGIYWVQVFGAAR